MKGLRRSLALMKPDKVSSYIGIALKAGRASRGLFAVERDVKRKKAFLVIVAKDASDNTKKDFSNMCAYYETPLVFLKSKDELGRITGREYCACVAINDEGIAKALRENIVL